ncbi:MAG: YqjF family protein [Gemmatimonadaceae bacterium]
MPGSDPSRRTLGHQRWSDLLFLHWRFDAATVQATLPPGLIVDTFAGDAWVGIMPFAMGRVRPAFLPPVPWLSWFLELNVRTYVRDAQGTPGVWFYSLDCNQPVGVEIGRRVFHLPYQHAHLQARRNQGTIEYFCRRRGKSDPPWAYAWQTSDEGAPAAVGSLAHFLVERYVLFSADARGRLYRGRVSHTPYRIHTPHLGVFTTGPAACAGFTPDGAPASVLAADPVAVSIHPLVRC